MSEEDRRRFAQVGGYDQFREKAAVAWLAANYIPCPACGDPQAGPIHRTSARLWQDRAGRAARHDGTDPVSGLSAGDAQRHLDVITAAVQGAVTPIPPAVSTG